MRQLKNFMKAKKPMWRCGECKCVTLQCWRDNDEFCNCGTSSEGLGVEYAFKNWNGTILKKWSIDEWATPKAPANPTREATAEYTYTFAGWDPEVGPISEDTVYTATYTSTVNQYTVTIESNDDAMGTVDVSEVTADYGTAISVVDNVLTIGETTVTATAESGYAFSSWGTLPETVTGNLTITATFESSAPAPYEIQNVAYYEYEEFGEEGGQTYSEKLYLFANNNSSSNCIYIDTVAGTVTAMWAFADSKFDYVVGLDTVNRREYIFEQLLAYDIVEQMITDIGDYTTWEQHEVVKFANNNNEYTYMAALFNATTAMNSRQNNVISAFNTAHDNGDVILELYNS